MDMKMVREKVNSLKNLQASECRAVFCHPVRQLDDAP